MIIGLSGYAGSGKDTVANIIMERYSYKRIAFADNVRAMLYELNISGVRDIVDGMGWERAKRLQGVRQLLQDVGVAARNHIAEDVWVTAALRKIEDNKNYVITDVRFPNEADAIKSLGGSIWKINRPGIGPVNSHISESAMDYYEFDKIIVNGSGLDGLVSQIESIVDDF